MTDLERRAEEYADEQIGCGDGYYEWTDVKQAYIVGATEETKELQEENKQAKEIIRECMGQMTFHDCEYTDAYKKAEAFIKEKSDDSDPIR